MSKLAHMFYAYKAIINKHFNCCCFIALAYIYTTLDKVRAVFFSIYYLQF